MSKDTKLQIDSALRNFSKGNLFDNAINLFKTLGYNTERQSRLHQPNFNSFKENFIKPGARFNEDKALVKDWKFVDLLFQLGAGEMQKQESLFKATVERNEPASYLFFAIELADKIYSRNELSQITREVNNLFPMHVFVLFKCGSHLSLSLIDRRPHKKIIDRDVLEKVTHVYNVSISNPHAAHVHILYTFSFDAIAAESRKRRIESFNDLHSGWRKVISTDILNRQFYLDYSKLSVKLINAIYPLQVKNKLIAHQGVLNLLNRIMFIYFVQKKEWIMKDENFIIHFWNDYKTSDSQNGFHEPWLNSIFFSAFNGKAFKTPKALMALPEPYKTEIINFPYLNGGLFAYNNDYDNFLLDDKAFEDIFKFFESYIFTIAEDTPYDVNLEINPELLGKMYEGMINATDLNDVDAEHGIIYTERPEINFMTRRSFVEVLDKKMDGALSREFLYHFIFDEPQQKHEVLKRYKASTKNLRDAVKSVTVCDPACGSGSMLLGVIQLQMELLRVLDAYDNKPHTPKDDFDIKKQLISECIYGVDIKEWAVRIAELRLWLYMIAEAEFSKEELTQAPLLPNLDFKLRCGNSLLQKFGNADFTITGLLKDRDKRINVVKPLHEFIKKKKAFILNQAESNTTYKDLEEVGRAVFLDFIQKFIIEKEQQLHNRKVKQGSMFAEAKQSKLFEEESAKLLIEMENLKKLRALIVKQKRLPFSYDIDFMEVFLAKENDPGFDLIIGNPPYVRQEQILPPEDGVELERLLLPENKNEKATVNKNYKEELTAKVYKTYPFLATTITTPVEGKNKTIPVYGSKVPGRSDLYTYFQLLCPAYLNNKGTFCFIISNSWLDVDFGSFVQQFLLKHTSLYALYDCNVRSFDAKVNTIIYLHSSIKNNTETREVFYKTLQPADNPVQFVMNKIDYANASYAPLLLEQEHCRKNTFKDLYRVIMLTQKELYAAGYDEEQSQFAGDKWGGKYLRAPEIYYTILQKGKDKLVELNDIAQISPGCYAGVADFFYVNKKIIDEYQIEHEYLKPLLRNSDSINSLNFTNTEWFVISCKEEKSKIKQGLRKYIEWGEQQVTRQRQKTQAGIPYPNTESVKNRQPGWWAISDNNLLEAKLFMQYVGSERFYCPFSKSAYVSDRSFHRIIAKDSEGLATSLNSSIVWFFVLLMGRSNLGDGALKFEKNDALKLLLLNPSYIKNHNNALKNLGKRLPLSILSELGFDRNEPIRQQQPNPLPDRKELDDIIFDELNLTTHERNEVYWSVAELVKQRLDKAASR